ncbi:MAG TPA: aldehyde dehydrogenase family protein [Bacteriovoracaceae bacterium]|nr:aldehyde dehydrogenase family protein [Bacteriovoracaceae bacterium]
MRITNPATNELIKEITEDNAQAVGAKYNRAKSAQTSWSQVPLEKRIASIQRFHDLLDQNKDNLARTLTSEVGKPLQESYNEINGARGRIKFFIDNAHQWLAPKEMNNDGNTVDHLAFDPLGVVCNISAWNYPFLVGVNVFVPALIAGNSVLYKPSEFSSLTGINIETLLHEAGIPRDAFIAVLGAAKTGDALLDLPCDGYFFTGSFKTGKYIAEKVAPKLVPVGLELGGKDPLYVTDQIVDLNKVAGAVAEGCFYNNGQSCCAVERVYVHEKVYDSFIEKFVAETRKLKVGDPLSKESNQGALTRESHLSFLDSQVQDAVKKGAKLLTGGKRLDKNNFYEPTVLVNVNHQMNVMSEETFGPVIGIMKVKDDTEAVKLMNDTEYGLTASVYCEDTERAKKILSQVDAGTSYINCCDRVSPYLPWAGRKHSGLGATLSYLGILAFAKPRGWHIRKG